MQHIQKPKRKPYNEELANVLRQYSKLLTEAEERKKEAERKRHEDTDKPVNP